MKTNKSYLLIAAVLTFLFSLQPIHAQTNGDIVDRLNKTLGVRLPSEYEAKVKEFAANDTIMRTRSATAFTEQFIIEQFKNDWGIDRQNQLLFMWTKIYGGISQKKLYNWLDDNNEARSGDYKKSLRNIADFYDRYKKGFKEYMDSVSAEARQQSAEARQQSAEARQQSAEARQQSAEARQQSAEARQQSAEARQQSTEALTRSLNHLVWFFNRYHMKDKEAIPPNETQDWKNKAKEVFTRCKEENLNYKAILRKELGDDEKVKEMLKFYGIE